MQHAEVSIPIEVGGAELDDPGVVTDAAVLSRVTDGTLLVAGAILDRFWDYWSTLF